MAGGFSKSLAKMSAYCRNSIRISLFSQFWQIWTSDLDFFISIWIFKDFLDFSKWPDLLIFFLWFFWIFGLVSADFLSNTPLGKNQVIFYLFLANNMYSQLKVVYSSMFGLIC